MKTRLNMILNGVRDFSVVVKNLKKLFTSEDDILVYTMASFDTVTTTLKDELSVDDKFISDNVYYSKFNKYKKSEFSSDEHKRIIVLTMPNNRFDTISGAFNSMFKFADDNHIARFYHVFCDDMKISDDKMYEPSLYETFMNDFGYGIYLDAKTNTGNYVFKKLSPRFVFLSKKLPYKVCYYQYEGRDHFVIDRSIMNLNFNENLKHLFITEMVIRAKNDGFIKHLTFYPDIFIDVVTERDRSLEFSKKNTTVLAEYDEDERFILNDLGESLDFESDVRPLIDECVAVINKNKQ